MDYNTCMITKYVITELIKNLKREPKWLTALNDTLCSTKHKVKRNLF